MPRSKPKHNTGGRKLIPQGTVYGPFTVGKPVGFREIKVVIRKYTYAVTCRCGRKYERYASDLHQAKKADGCMACTTKLRGPVGKVERNAAIAADRKAGMSLAAVAEKYGVSVPRVSIIAKREAARA